MNPGTLTVDGDGVKLTQFYQSYIDLKCNSFFQEQSYLTGQSKNWFKAVLRKKYQNLAFQFLFPNEAESYLGDKFLHLSTKSEELVDLSKSGLILYNSDGHVAFLDTKSAYYLAAELIAKWLQKPYGRHSKYPSVVKLLVTNVLLSSNHKITRLFLNNCLPNTGFPFEMLRMQGQIISKLWEHDKSIFFGNQKQTFLHVLAQERNDKIVDLFTNFLAASSEIEHLISLITVRDVQNNTALYAAAKNNYSTFIQMLLDATNYSPSTIEEVLLSTILRTTEDEHDSAISCLLQHISTNKNCDFVEGFFSKIEDCWGLIKAFIAAAKEDNIKNVNKSLEACNESVRNCLLLATDKDGNTALQIAVKNGRYDMVKYLVDQGADVYNFDANRMAAVHLAAKFGHMEIVIYLAEIGVNINDLDDFGLSPLAWASKSGHLNTVKYLLQNGANISSIDKNGKTSARHAEEEGHNHIKEYLEKQNTVRNILNEHKEKSLFWAITKKDLEIVCALVEYQLIDINRMDGNGMTALQHAIEACQWNIVEYLINQNAHLNIADNYGITALERTLEAGKWDVVEFLLRRGANISNLSVRVDPLKRAAASKQWSTVIFMIESGANTNALTTRERHILLQKMCSQPESLQNIIYNIIRLGNLSLLEQFIADELQQSDRDSFENSLGRAYEEIQLKNIKLSKEMLFAVENRLVDFRFFSDQRSIQKFNFGDVVQRIKMSNELMEKLITEYSGKQGKNVDQEFVITARYLAQNCHILKRQLKFTYEMLPWEEIEFCLVMFVDCIIKPQKIDVIYALVLDKIKLLTHLKHFHRKLSERLTKLQQADISCKPKPVKREIVIKNIISDSPEFKQLYEDYGIIKDVYSLNRIESYLKLATSVNLQGIFVEKLLLERTLQIIGETLKNTLDSPNLSNSVHKILIQFAPRNMKEIVTSLRDALSHVHTLIQKVQLEDGSDADFFGRIQSDLKKLTKEIIDVLYRKKIEAVKMFLNKIIFSTDFDEIKELTENIESLNLDNTIVGTHYDQVLSNLWKLLQQIVDYIPEKNDEEMRLLAQITNILDSNQTKLSKMKETYTTAFESIEKYIHLIHHSDNLTVIKNVFTRTLITISSEINQINLKEVIPVLTALRHSFAPRLSEDQLHSVLNLAHQMFCIIQLEMSRVKGIDMFKESLKKEFEDVETYATELENIFTSVEKKLSENATIFREDLETKKHLHTTKLMLIKFFDEQGNDAVKMNNQFSENIQRITDEDSYNAAIKTLKLKTNGARAVSSYYSISNNLKENIDIVKKADNPYGNIINKVKTLNLFSSEKCIKDLKAFISTFKCYQKYKNQLDKAVEETIQEKILYYYKQRLGMLKQLFCTDDMQNLIEADGVVKASMEMLILDLAEILENASLFLDNKLFLDDYSPILIGKSLRNYLAHGSPLIENLSSNPTLAIISNGLKLLQETELVNRKDKLVGQHKIWPIQMLRDRYQNSLSIVKTQNKMFAAVRVGKIRTIEDCLDKGVDVKVKDLNGWTILEHASASDNVQVLQSLLSVILDVDYKSLLSIAAKHGSINVIEYFITRMKFDVKNTDHVGKTLLHIAARYGRYSVIELLIKHGCSINTKTLQKFSPLHFAAQNGHIEVVKLFLKRDVQVNAQNISLFSSLHLAARNGYSEVVKILLQYNAFVNAKAIESWTPLHVAAECGHYAVVDILLQNDADLEALTDTGSTPLYIAVYKGHINIVEVLLKNGANVRTSKNYLTLLHIAAQNGYEDITRILLKYNAKPTVVSKLSFTPLHMSAMEGHLGVVKALLEHSNVEVNAGNFENATALHLSAQSGHKDVVASLLKIGADVNAQTKDGYTPIYLASLEGHKEVVETLLCYNPSVNVANKNKITPLHIAAQQGHIDIVRVLLDNGANVNFTANNKNNWTPLFLSCKMGHNKTVNLLLSKGAKPDIGDKDDYKPLHVACYHGHKDIVTTLLKFNADVNAVNNGNVTALDMAAQNDYTDIVKILLGKGDNISDKNSVLALHLATQNGLNDIVETLLKHGANVNAVDENNGFTLLHLACQFGQKKVVDVLINYGADVNARTIEEVTPLYMAARGGFSDIVITLLDHSSDVSAVDYDDTTPLHISCEHGHFNVVRALLQYRAAINVKTKSCRLSPLYLASSKEHKDIVDMLLEKGADVNIIDAKGVTPLILASKGGNQEIAKTLIENGADVNFAQEDVKYTPLHWAAQEGHLEVVKLLLENATNVHAIDVRGLTPLYAASLRGHASVVQTLLNNGADANTAGDGNFTALHVASQNGYRDVVEILLEHGAEVNTVIEEKATALYFAVANGHKDVVEVLVKGGADVNVTTNNITPLYLAELKGFEDIAAMLQEATVV